MPLTVESLSDVVNDTVQARAQFIRRLFLKNTSETSILSWEHTGYQMETTNIARPFQNTRGLFVAFLNDPVKETFDEWSEKVYDLLEDGGVIDDWNASPLFKALITTKYRDLNTIVGPIKPLENVKDVRDEQVSDPSAGVDPRAFATVILALASVADLEPTMEQVAGLLIAESYDGEEDEDDEEEDDEE